MDRLAELLHLQTDQPIRDRIFRSQRSYLLGWTSAKVLAESGNAAAWLRNCHAQNQQLQHCPWCSQVFTDVNQVAYHMQTRVELHHDRCLAVFGGGLSKEVCCINFVKIRRLQAGFPMDLQIKWFRNTLRWANLLRTAILQEAAMRMAWTRFWLPIFRQNNKRAKAGRQVYQLYLNALD
jgi:hypothetical protein